MIKSLLIFLILLLPLTAENLNKNLSWGVIVLDFTGFRNNNGQLFVAIYNDSSAFLNKNKIPALKLKNNIEKEHFRIILDSVQFGEYALSCFHDENNNGILDKNLFGLPSEGYGLSNNVKPSLGPPSWNDCKFVLNKDTLLLEIKIRY